MSALDSQLQGKYKNIPFDILNEALNEVGQAWVKHTYPKSGVQYFEPMGQNPFSETISLYFKGENYVERFESFKKAIQNPAPGRLYSPTYGIFDNVIAIPGTFTSDQKTLGNITASIQFAVTIDRPAPIDSEISEQDVASKALEATLTLQEAFIADYSEPISQNNFLAASIDAAGLAEEIKDITGIIKETRNFLRKIDLSIRAVDKYAALLLNPGQPLGYLQSILLSTRNTGAFSLFSKIANMGKGQSNSMNDINSGIVPKTSTVFPDVPADPDIDTTINLWDNDTLERQQRNDGRIAIINTFRMTGIIGMFESASEANYTTTEEIDKVSISLENYYNALVENAEYKIITESMKKIIDELKALTEKVLARKRQQAYGVIEIIEVRPISSVLLAYKLYGEYIKDEIQLFYMASIIAGLNRSQAAHVLQGTVRVVEIA